MDAIKDKAISFDILNSVYSKEANKLLNAAWLETPLGLMLAIADEEALYFLEFLDGRTIGRDVERLQLKTKSMIIPGTTPIIDLVKDELAAYFKGQLKQFQTPLQRLGSAFQQRAWDALMNIPYGQTRSYAEQAMAVGQITAYRAVANANGSNLISIIIPCHRIINSNGELGGYGGGLTRKKWLIEHERSYC